MNSENFDDETDLVADEDEEEEGIAQIGKSAHRCSMIKKYTMPTFFTPTKSRKAFPQTELKPK